MFGSAALALCAQSRDLRLSADPRLVQQPGDPGGREFPDHGSREAVRCGVRLPSMTTYLGRDVLPDAEQRQMTEDTVAEWRKTGRLPFPIRIRDRSRLSRTCWIIVPKGRQATVHRQHQGRMIPTEAERPDRPERVYMDVLQNVNCTNQSPEALRCAHHGDPATDSMNIRPPIPWRSDHWFHEHPATLV